MAHQPSHHGTCVALDGKGVFITGASGSGKSALGLMLMGLGCQLVADDRVILTRQGDDIIATCPPTIKNIIEARNIGILNAQSIDTAKIVLAVDLNETEHERLPNYRYITLLGCDVASIRAIDSPHFAASILQILKSGWSDR